MTISSEIPLPELNIASSMEKQEHDVHIIFGDLGEKWKQNIQSSNNYAIIDGHFYIYHQRVGIFSVQNGNRIVVTPEPGSDMDIIRLILLGTGMGILLFQRRVLPLHGSAVVIDGKAYAIVGDKGAGKSTLAAAFVNHGFSLLTDDVIAVSTTPNSTFPIVTPAYPQQKLWQESLDHLEMDSVQYNTLYKEFPKYSIPLASGGFYTEDTPLAGVFELSKSDLSGCECRVVSGLECFPILHYHTYRNFALPLLELEQWHFQTMAFILQRVKVYKLRRGNEGFTAFSLVNEILNTVKEGA